MEVAIIREYNETLNNSVNYERLDTSLRGAGFGIYKRVEEFNGLIYIIFSTLPSVAQLALLDTVIANHNGQPPVTTEGEYVRRRIAFNQLVQMAHDHPILGSDGGIKVNAYLTHIDNYKNGFLTDGVKANLIAKIADDRQDVNHSSYVFLNEVINEAGNKTFEYLISQIIKI